MIIDMQKSVPDLSRVSGRAHLNPPGCLTCQVPALLLEVVLVQRLSEQHQSLHTSEVRQVT